MFTGLIEGIGKVKVVRRLRDDMALTITPLFQMTDSRVGDSLSVDGVCLTITEISEGALRMDVSAETVMRSTISILRQGDMVNLERALRLTDRLGGHLVTGHVDGVGKILKKESQNKSWLFKIGIDEALSRYTIEKGSVAVDGISLTINKCEKKFFDVNIIPQTAQETTLLRKKTGDLVNIETDLIGKYIEKFFLKDTLETKKEATSAVNMEMLIKQGFGD
jgi:riboflavin synthase